jgi:streptogramin lyase
LGEEFVKSKAMLAAAWCLVGSVLVLSQAAFAQEQGGGKKQGLGQPQGVRQVTVTEIPGVVAAGAKWMLAWQGTDNADGIIGTADGGLLFAQEQPNRISKLDKNDKVSVFLENTHGAGALTIDSHGRILAAERTCTDPGRQPAQCSEPTAVGVVAPERKALADNADGKSLGRLNDLTVDKKGNVYFNGSGTFHLNAKGQVSTIGENIRTNGIILSRDEKTLYVTNGGALVAFDIQPNGRVGNQRSRSGLTAIITAITTMGSRSTAAGCPSFSSARAEKDSKTSSPGNGVSPASSRSDRVK